METPIQHTASDLGRNPFALRENPVGTQELGNLKARHHLIVEMIMVGKTDIQIAEALGMNNSYISIVRRSRLITQEIEARLSILKESGHDEQKRITGLAGIALERIAQVLLDEAEDTKHVLRASEFVLGLAGHVKPNAPQVNLSGTLSQADLDLIKARAIGSESELTEYVEVPKDGD